jgi:hypothetical protein
VPPVWSSLAVIADVEVVSVALTQPKGNMSSAVGRAGMSELRVAWPESWTRGPHVAKVESWVPRGARLKMVKQATQEP